MNIKCDTTSCPSCQDNRCIAYRVGEICDCLGYHYSPTNADRLKADDKALAEKLADCTYRKDHALSRPSWTDPYGNSYLTKKDAVDEWLEWLRQPAEED